MTRHDERYLAPYATRAEDGGRRAHEEPPDALRSPFELDRHRIIESTAFRRLERKTQVFAAAHHDHFRTRLTHSLEVSQIARCLARQLAANEDLAEAIALAHDLGHPPFGHAGEAALAEAMKDCDGFNHNTHSLRVVEFLEHPFPAFRGLNLSAATRAGMAMHATQFDIPAGADEDRGTGEVGSPVTGDEPCCESDEPSIEAQIVSIADRIAFNCHDLEDAIGAGFVDLDQLDSEVALWRDAREAWQGAASAPADRIHAIRRPVLDAMLGILMSEVVQTSMQRLAHCWGPWDPTTTPFFKPPVRGVNASPERARPAREPDNRDDAPLSGMETGATPEGDPPETGNASIAMSGEVDAKLVALEQFLAGRVYGHPEVAKMDATGRAMVLSLFNALRADPNTMPTRFAARVEDQGVQRVVCDYIAGMTDRFCEAQHDRLLGSNM